MDVSFHILTGGLALKVLYQRKLFGREPVFAHGTVPIPVERIVRIWDQCVRGRPHHYTKLIAV